MLSIANSCAGLYGVGLAAVGMLSAGAIAVSLESCVIISRFAESMTGRGFAAKMLDETASGNAVETELTEQYFNVLSAALTALVLFAAYTQVVSGGVEVSLVDPSVIVGLLVGAAVAGSFAVLIMSAVGKIAVFLRGGQISKAVLLLIRLRVELRQPAARWKTYAGLLSVSWLFQLYWL